MNARVEIDTNKDWYRFNVEKALNILYTSFAGLTDSEVEIRREKFGLNELKEGKKTSLWILFLSQFNNILTYILFLATIISYFLDKEVETIAILTIVILAGVFGFIQEFQAGKAIDSLRKMASPHALVVRDGIKKIIKSSELVPGDVIILKMGDIVPADARIIEAQNFKIEESALTGESLSVSKRTDAIKEENVQLGDRKNLVYMGTIVSYGRGKAVVIQTGMNTEFGKIAQLLSEAESRKTPLQENLDSLAKKIGIFAIVLAVVMSLFQIVISHVHWQDVLLWGVALAVAVIPEAFPAVVTITLAIGVRRMIKRKALIRKLPAVEILGSVNIICTDKTGTLTQDEMTIRKILSGGRTYTVTGSGYNPKGEFFLDGKLIIPDEMPDLEKTLVAGALCTDTSFNVEDNKYNIMGDPTEGSIIIAAEKAGIEVEELKADNPRIREVPFTSESKKMTTVNKLENEIKSFGKGAPEVILKSCSYILFKGQVIPMTETDRDSILAEAYEMGQEALRVLAISEKFICDKNNPEAEKIIESDVENDMIFLGLVGMIDPPRLEVKKAIDTCKHAGIKPIMITGDHKVTAMAIAKELGILTHGSAISGAELEKMSDEEFEQRVENTEVYARISPAHKLKIVDALIKKQNIVAMTGDGVNDAPSLKKADIGIAMGITGTDVSKQASDMILTDDNFASIVSAVEEGRTVFENIRKYMIYLFSGNMGTVFAILIAIFIKIASAIEAVQILYINFLMDGILAIALGVEPPEEVLMHRKPRNVKEGLLNKFSLTYIVVIGIFIALVTIGVFYYAHLRTIEMGMEERAAQRYDNTMFFLTLIFARLFNGFNCRSLSQSIFKMKLLGNKTFIYSFITAIVLTILIIYIPTLNIAFFTVPLSLEDWLISAFGGFLVLGIVEIWKSLRRKREKKLSAISD